MKLITLLSVFMTVLILGACQSPQSAPAQRPVAEELASMPEPITKRYPLLDQANTMLPGKQNSVEMRAPFSCTENEDSILTDDIPLLDVSFIEADVRDAILELSLLTGISIITDDSIEGLVSVNFSGKSLEEILAAVIAPGNFGYKVYESFIYVGSQSPVSPSFHLLSNTCMYKPVFLHPEQIVEMLTPYYQQYVNYLEGHDYLSITAPSSIQNRIQRDIKVFDQAPPQILLEMSIIEVSEQALDMLGIKWNREVDAGSLLAQNGGNSTSLITLSPARDSASPVAQALIHSMSAMSSEEDMVIKAMPSMVTLNGKEANFSSMQTSWLSVITTNNDARQRSTVTYGVTLRIVPYVSENNQIRLEILEASVSDLSTDLKDEPKLISHGISTSVLMTDGETLVLGGLLQKKRRNQRSRVPGADRTPLLGGLFRQKENDLENSEVLIVIRPQVLEG